MSVVVLNTSMSKQTFIQLIEANENMVQVYHITHDVNLPKIRHEGLVPMLGPNSQEIGENYPAIHVFLDMDTVEEAMMNWDTMDWHDEDTELSLVTFNVPASMLVSPYNKSVQQGIGTAEIHEPIPPSMITSISEIS